MSDLDTNFIHQFRNIKYALDIPMNMQRKVWRIAQRTYESECERYEEELIHVYDTKYVTHIYEDSMEMHV